MSEYPTTRLRRYRRTPGLRRLFGQPLPGPESFVWPTFIVPGNNKREPISSLPGQNRLSIDNLLVDLNSLIASGVNAVLLFGLADESDKDAEGSYAFNDEGTVQTAIRELRSEYPDLVIVSDVCVCAYTDHGHCGPLNKQGHVDNDTTNEILAQVALSHAAAGADIVAPSAMMDGQVQAIRAALDDAEFENTMIMSYSTKFASAMYGPFRDAENSAPQQGDRQSYQASAADPLTALRESELDEQEGADILMVKPALFYLDILSQLCEQTSLPLAAYNVSGEYAMLHAAAEKGYGDLRAMVRESTLAIARAGADIIISYWANQYAAMFGDA